MLSEKGRPFCLGVNEFSTCSVKKTYEDAMNADVPIGYLYGTKVPTDTYTCHIQPV